MNQDIELMRNLLLWVADAKPWELAYCEKQVSLNHDGSPDKLGMYSIYPGTSLEEGTYQEVCFRPLPSHAYPTPNIESTRDQFLWYGKLTPMPSSLETTTYELEDGTKKTLHKYQTYLPAGFPLRKYWMGRDQFEVSYNLNQLDLAGLLKVRYFHSEKEWSTEPPLSMYLTPKGADFVAYIRDTQRWEDLKHVPSPNDANSAVPRRGFMARVLSWNRGASQASGAIDEAIQTITNLSIRAAQMTELIQRISSG